MTNVNLKELARKSLRIAKDNNVSREVLVNQLTILAEEIEQLEKYDFKRFK